MKVRRATYTETSALFAQHILDKVITHKQSVKIESGRMAVSSLYNKFMDGWKYLREEPIPGLDPTLYRLARFDIKVERTSKELIIYYQSSRPEVAPIGVVPNELWRSKFEEFLKDTSMPFLSVEFLNTPTDEDIAWIHSEAEKVGAEAMIRENKLTVAR